MPAQSGKSLSRKFWLGCVSARLALALAVGVVPLTWLPLVGVVSLFGVAGLLYRFFTYNEQQVGAFHQPVTWNGARPVHALLWFVFAILALSESPSARIIPYLDLVVGIVVYILIH